MTNHKLEDYHTCIVCEEKFPCTVDQRGYCTDYEEISQSTGLIFYCKNCMNDDIDPPDYYVKNEYKKCNF